jgi:hypothetical protein
LATSRAWLVKDVVDSFGIHPFTLSKWRKLVQTDVDAVLVDFQSREQSGRLTHGSSP